MASLTGLNRERRNTLAHLQRVGRAGCTFCAGAACATAGALLARAGRTRDMAAPDGTPAGEPLLPDHAGSCCAVAGFLLAPVEGACAVELDWGGVTAGCATQGLGPFA